MKLCLALCLLLSFITDLWTPRNVALVIFAPSQKIVPARLPQAADFSRQTEFLQT